MKKARVFERLDGIDPTFWYNYIIPGIRSINNNACESCGKVSCRLDIHHLSYKKLNINTLMLVCRGCHKIIHHDSKIILNDYFP